MMLIFPRPRPACTNISHREVTRIVAAHAAVIFA
jgi:hypothetical protein